jgi:hypothetical protein
MKKRIRRIILIALFVISGLLFVAKFGGPRILRFYIEAGVGNCRDIPVLCISPQEEMVNPVVDETYVAGLLPYDLPGVHIHLPKGFTVIKQRITKVYYKKWRQKAKGATIYLLYEPKDFFVRLFPQLKKDSINNDYDFISRVMYARVNEINSVVDAFFVVMKGIFIPDLADQHNVKIIKYASPKQKGFIGYNLGTKENYFDCNIVREEGYFKIYIKDKARVLDLSKVAAILSTMEKIPDATLP